MTRLRWWFRIVGAFYLLLALMNLYVMFFTDGQAILAGSPFPVTALTVRVATDYWSSGAFGMLGAGLFLLWAARAPERYVNVARYAAWLELTTWGAYDVFALARGYDPASYGAFGVIHLIIIATGFWFARPADGARPAATA